MESILVRNKVLGDICAESGNTLYFQEFLIETMSTSLLVRKFVNFINSMQFFFLPFSANFEIH